MSRKQFDFMETTPDVPTTGSPGCECDEPPASGLDMGKAPMPKEFEYPYEYKKPTGEREEA